MSLSQPANTPTNTSTNTSTTQQGKDDKTKPNQSWLDSFRSIFGTSTPVAQQEKPTTTGGTRKRKHKTRKNKTKGRINFSKIKWGSFTRIYHNYLHKHPSMKKQVPTLEQFAHYVNKHPNKFTKKTHKKAIFYTNIIEKK